MRCVWSKVIRNCNHKLGMLGYSAEWLFLTNKSFLVLFVAVPICVSDGRQLEDYLKTNEDILRVCQNLCLLSIT